LEAAPLGLRFCRGARDFVWGLRPPIFRHAGLHLDLDSHVLMYSFLVSIATGLIFGTAPALAATRSDLATNLKERTAQSPVRPGRWSSRSVLVVCQIAFSMMALVGAGLFVRSIQNAMRIDPGFDAAHLGVVAFNVADQGYDEPRGREYQRRVIELASTIPGVSAAALSRDAPFQVGGARTVLLDGQATGGRYILATAVGQNYFHAVGIPLVRGR